MARAWTLRKHAEPELQWFVLVSPAARNLDYLGEYGPVTGCPTCGCAFVELAEVGVLHMRCLGTQLSEVEGVLLLSGEWPVERVVKSVRLLCFEGHSSEHRLTRWDVRLMWLAPILAAGAAATAATAVLSL